jgi:hypothetical protein
MTLRLTYYGVNDGMNYCDGQLGTWICEKPAMVKHDGKWYCEECYEAIQQRLSFDPQTRRVNLNGYLL